MKTHPNIAEPDTIYAALIAANETLSLEQSAEFSMRLVFLLANQIGDSQTLLSCIEAARQPFITNLGEPE